MCAVGGAARSGFPIGWGAAGHVPQLSRGDLGDLGDLVIGERPLEVPGPGALPVTLAVSSRDRRGGEDAGAEPRAACQVSFV